MSFTKFLQDDPLLTREQVMATLIQIADELDMPDKRGAAVVCGMAISVEVGVPDNDPPKEIRFWCPANHADQESFNYPHDSESDDGRSCGYLQQQKSASGALWWGTTEQEMNLHSAASEFMKRLKKAGYDASNAVAAGVSAQRIQGSGFPDRYQSRWDDINRLYDKVAASSGPAPVQPPPPPPPAQAPLFVEHNLIDGSNSQSRNGKKPRLFVLHTEEGNMIGQPLDAWMDNNSVSYHYIVDPDAFGADVWDLVDTDRASWSVLDANNYTINLVFGGSYAGQTRNEWLQKFGTAIRNAAYIAVQDCRKYGIPIQLLVGNNYSRLRTENGITDHLGITKGLGIGTHTDVGAGFPWDVFNQYLQQFAAGATVEDGFLMALSDADQKLLLDRTNQIWGALFNPVESASIYRNPAPNDPGNMWATKDLVRNMDGMAHEAFVERRAAEGDYDSLQRMMMVAAGEGADKSETAVAHATAALKLIPADVLSAFDAAEAVKSVNGK